MSSSSDDDGDDTIFRKLVGHHKISVDDPAGERLLPNSSGINSQSRIEHKQRSTDLNDQSKEWFNKKSKQSSSNDAHLLLPTSSVIQHHHSHNHNNNNNSSTTPSSTHFCITLNCSSTSPSPSPSSSVSMVRDRTAALRAASGTSGRDDVTNNSSNNGGNAGRNTGGGGDKSEFNQDGQVMIPMQERPRSMESFYNEVSQVQDSLDTLQSYIDGMRKLASSVVSALNDGKEIEKSFEDLTMKIQRTAERIREKLGMMKSKIDNTSESSKLTAEFRIKETQHTSLQRRFADMMYMFYQLQTEYRERCKKVLRDQLEVMGRVTSDDEIEKILETKDPALFTEQILGQTQVAKQQLADIQARHQQFINLEKSIRDLRDLFFDVHMLVQEQGELVDRIETQVGKTRDFVQKANEETGKALIYQQKARRKKTMIIICLAVIALVTVGAIVLSIR
ncbi:syntaxin-1A-like [Brevipalpus obovatus]|uniref:syntaxin-1A-like n=1 Tax=Brevipalpus obovatus TaxID=246614 RepID=UPI003D9F0523